MYDRDTLLFRYKKYPDEMLKQAMQSVQLGHKTVAQAAKEYNIPRQTLQYRLFKRKKNFHVFAPNIPYTNNFFIENYNNTPSENSDVTVPMPKSTSRSKSTDVTMDSQVDIENLESLDESEIRFNLEKTVKELLQCSENIIAKSAPDLKLETQDQEDAVFSSVSDSGFRQGSNEAKSGQNSLLDTDVVIDDVVSEIKTEIVERSMES